jgi:hypothetical protein
MRPKATTSRIQVKTSLIEGKWLEMLKEDRTARTRVAIMFNPDTAPLGRAYFLGHSKLRCTITSGGRLRPAASAEGEKQ